MQELQQEGRGRSMRRWMEVREPTWRLEEEEEEGTPSNSRRMKHMLAGLDITRMAVQCPYISYCPCKNYHNHANNIEVVIVE